MAPTTSSLRGAVERLLGDEQSLDDFVSSRRDRNLSWRRIRDDLRDATGTDVTHETLRAWFPDEVDA